MITVRLACATAWVDVRLREINGRWIASADTTGGPSLGLASEPELAIAAALEPFGEMLDELLASVPAHLADSPE